MRPARQRELVDDVRAIWQVSIRRACRNLRVDPSSYHYKSRRPSQASLKQRIKEIAETRVRYGYRRIHVRREGWLVNAKRVNRLYREMGLQLRNKSPKRKVKAKLREGRSTPAGANDVWGDGFRARSALRRPQDPHSHGDRCLYALRAGDRGACTLHGF